MLSLISEQKRITNLNAPAIVCDNFLKESELDFLREEIYKREHLYSREGYEGKKTIRDHFDPRYCGTQFITEPRSFISYIFRNKFWQEFGDILAEHKDSGFRHSLVSEGAGPILLSCYQNTDYYGMHIDTDLNCILTVVLFISFNEGSFTGGDFILDDEIVPFKNNRLIIFPSCTPHGVTKISMESTKYMDSRFSLQYFISAIPPKKPLIDESSNIQ